MTTTINRDPFASANFVRKTIPKEERGRGHQLALCHWCLRPGRFRYGWADDRISARPVRFSEPFCSVGCYRAHYDTAPGRRF